MRTATTVVDAEAALPGRADPVPVAPANIVTGNPMVPPFPEGHETIVLGMGCFWGAEKILWQLDGVWTTAAGYAGGWTPNPTYEETCTGASGHTEAVLVVFDPQVLPVEKLLATFFEWHDPTQGMRQGNDMGTQYRSAVLTTTPEQLEVARRIAEGYQKELDAAGYGPLTTEIDELGEVRSGTFYYAEDYHQQYLVKNPGGYDCHVRSGVACPV
ncbi:peptide-methionine (S)-S-oxide reductase MsrA [Dietzia maris]|uniref:Peptide methionine sulfoxide reductase MsrA n=2 Tax=Dietzia maris TaxID=37915 RepID=A0AAE4QVU8_9ACTN|nr:peptide-methionine (S)-S-oxide reductase MsrA [Dietzia maris]MDV6299326.1 peptide-methionine (S)-S-oxide reductase MsrA [Dietzia maris]